MGNTDSKTQLHTALIKVASETIPADQDLLWSSFWQLPTSTEIIFSALTGNELHDLRNKQPDNYVTLIRKVVSQLEQMTSTSKPYSADETRQIQNCIALLTRLVPAAFEQFDLPDQLDSFEHRVFWTTSAANQRSEHGAGHKNEDEDNNKETNKDEDNTKDTNKDGATNEDTNADTAKVYTNTTAPTEHGASGAINSTEDTAPPHTTAPINSTEVRTDVLAPRVLALVVKLLFLPHFTVTRAHQVWYSGVGTTSESSVSASSAAMATNRVLSVQLLLALLSHDLYLTPALCAHRALRSPWLDYLTNPPRDSVVHSHVPLLLHSALNSAVRYDAVGWGVPYNHLLAADPHEALLYKSLQLLALLLNYSAHGAHSEHGDAPFTELQAEATDGTTDNLFIATLREITDRASLDLLYTMLTTLFGNPLRANSTYLPNSAKELNCHPELLILFWALIRNHPAFLKYLVTVQCTARKDLTVLYALLHRIYQGRKDPAQLGHVHLTVLILLVLSSERDFAISLNEPLTTAYKSQLDLPRFTGTHADLLVLVLLKLIMDGHRRLEALWDCILTVLANVSPYIKSLATVTANKLIKLFELTSRPSFVLAQERNHRYLFYQLELFNNVLQYQYEGNTHLVYAIIRERELFTKLVSLRIEAVAEDALDSNKEQFVPSPEWLQSWQSRLPINTVLRYLSSVVPQLNDVVSGDANDSQALLAFLKRTTAVGLLPVPHPILIRRYHSTAASALWLHSHIWGVLLVHNLRPIPLWSTGVRLVQLHSSAEKTEK
jgi:hypothetical protein